jgi:hypothetical protein
MRASAAAADLSAKAAQRAKASRFLGATLSADVDGLPTQDVAPFIVD